MILYMCVDLTAATACYYNKIKPTIDIRNLENLSQLKSSQIL